MNRRGFLGVIGAALAGLTIDPERLLWRAGSRTISIPRYSSPDWSITTDRPLRIGETFTIAGVYMTNPMTSRETAFMREFLILQPTGSGPVTEYFPKFIPSGRYRNSHVAGSCRNLKARPDHPGVKIYACNVESLFGKGV